MCVSPFSLLPSVAFAGCTVVFLEIGLSECVLSVSALSFLSLYIAFYTVYSLSILISREAGFDSLAKLAGWLRMEVPPPILAVFLPCRLP